jgi:hypothetical protein
MTDGWTHDGAFQWKNCISWKSRHYLQVAEDSKHNFEPINLGTRNRKSVQVWNRETLAQTCFF